MSVSAAGGAAGMQAAIIQLLKAQTEFQAETMEKLLAVQVEGQIHAQKMATAQNIIDVYA